MSKGKLYIAPVPISEGTAEKVLPAFNSTILQEIRFFVVERLKTARQFLRQINRTFPIDDSTFFELDKHQNYVFDPKIIQTLEEGIDVALMSESGYPGVADPGYQLVEMAHRCGIDVVPLVGPGSIVLALAASGLNGQQFSFNGYVSQKEPHRSAELKKYIALVSSSGYTQVFIETPYRNQRFFEDILKLGYPELKLCVAIDVTGDAEKIRTKSIAEWRKSKMEFDKRPCVFIFGN